jgi:hypothetical protein
MGKRHVHVVPEGSGWAVKVGGTSRPVSSHRTQANAMRAAKPVAEQRRSDVIIHRPNGKIRARDSYGNDPHPPKG